MIIAASAIIPAAVGGFFASLITSAALVRIAPQRRKADRPPLDARERSRVSVPRMGGTAVFLGVAVGILLLNALADGATTVATFAPPLGIALGGALILAIGLTDDIVSLAPRWKICGQCAAALLAWQGGFQIHSVGITPDMGVSLGALALPMTLLWIVTVANAVNLIDGLDGLAGGFSVVVLTMAGVIGAFTGQIGALATAVIGVVALAGFLRFNARSARVHLGDSGSLFVGFGLALVSVEVAREPGQMVLAPVPLLLLAVPLVDLVLTVYRRAMLGVSIALGDSQHVHHRLLGMGLSEGMAVLVLLALATLSGGTGVLAVLTPFTYSAWTIASLVAASVLVMGAVLVGSMRASDESSEIATRSAI